MIDDDDIAIGSPTTHLGDEAAVELLAFSAVAGLRGLLPLSDDPELVDFFKSAQYWLLGQVIQLLTAQVVGAALHIADTQLAEMRLQERQVLMKELLLQRLGAGGDDDPLSGADHRQQVGECLAGSSPCLDDQVTLVLKCLLDSLGHLQLPASKLVSRMRFRQHAAWPKEPIKRRSPRSGGCQVGGL